MLILDTHADPEALASRLGLCHHVSEWLGSCARNQVEKCARELSVEGPIRVRSTKIGEQVVDLATTTRKVGAIVGRSAGVDLQRPKSEIRVVYSKKVHMGRLLGSVARSAFEKRKNRYLPFTYPASLHPKFARALVNLTRVPTPGKLLDPFCGTGAIVAEGAIVGLDAIGSDFSERMIEGAGRNLSHLGLSAELHVCDVGDIASVIGRTDGIATDPPYGRSTSTRGEGISRLYERALVAFAEVLDSGSMVAMVVPETGLLRGASEFELEESHKLWVHRSLTRHFCVLRRI
ncbi:MAG: DNA methyltransferase [Thermoplasmata archaeon]